MISWARLPAADSGKWACAPSRDHGEERDRGKYTLVISPYSLLSTELPLKCIHEILYIQQKHTQSLGGVWSDENALWLVWGKFLWLAKVLTNLLFNLHKHQPFGEFYLKGKRGSRLSQIGNSLGECMDERDPLCHSSIIQISLWQQGLADHSVYEAWQSLDKAWKPL